MSGCTCNDCKSACMYRPGFFRREQIEPLAATLNLTLKELVQKHLQVDFFSVGELEDVMMLVPRLKGERGGTQIDMDPRGVCHWFVEGLCQIHDKEKPANCVELVHDETGKYVEVDREAIAKTWVGQEAFIEEVTGDYFSPEIGGFLGNFMLTSRPYYPDPDKPDPYKEGE